jgi:alpha-L-fucosidase
MLADIVSKNGNLLLNIPLRGDGTFDEKEQAVLEGIGAWMDINKEAIFETRPWTLFGEGPASAGAALSGEGFNEGRGTPFTAADVRFTTKRDVIYAILMDWPGDAGVNLKSLGKASAQLADGRQITAVSLLGSNSVLAWSQDESSLKATLPTEAPCTGPVVLKIITVPASRP